MKQKAHIKAAISDAIKVATARLMELESECENPSVASVYWKQMGKLELLDAMRDALNGDMVMFNIVTGLR